MKQKTIARALIGAGGIAAAGIIALFFVYLPLLAGQLREAYPEYAGLYWPGLLDMWAIAALFLLGLWEYFRVCVRIGRERSFCRENADSLRRIALYMAVSGALWLGAIFVPPMFFHVSIGPFWIELALCAMAAEALGILAWGLGKLLERAISLQEENDLTV